MGAVLRIGGYGLIVSIDYCLFGLGKARDRTRCDGLMDRVSLVIYQPDIELLQVLLDAIRKP